MARGVGGEERSTARWDIAGTPGRALKGWAHDGDDETTGGDAARDEEMRGLLNLLNLHFAGVAVLALVNLYLLVHMAFAWQAANSQNAAALADQTVAMKTAEIAKRPLEGLDEKLAQATKGSDRFYQQRLPYAISEMVAELGALEKKQGVRQTRAQYAYAPVLTGTAGELTGPGSMRV